MKAIHINLLLLCNILFAKEQKRTAFISAHFVGMNHKTPTAASGEREKHPSPKSVPCVWH